VVREVRGGTGERAEGSLLGQVRQEENRGDAGVSRHKEKK